jgi:protein-disulfide isomerase
VIRFHVIGAAVCLTVAPMLSVPRLGAAQGSPQNTTADRIQALEANQRELQRQIQALQTQLEELKALLLSRPAGPPGPPAVTGLVLPAGGATRGSAKSPLTIVEYTDFECPFCARYARESYPLLIREFVDAGRVRYVVRHLPLESIHPSARGAAQAAECARQQGKFWEMHDRLFANPQALSRADLERTADALGLTMPAFRQCVDSPGAAAAVSRDLDEALRAGITATPSFIIGTTQPDGSVKALRRLSGAQPYPVFKAALEGLLASP